MEGTRPRLSARSARGRRRWPRDRVGPRSRRPRCRLPGSHAPREAAPRALPRSPHSWLQDSAEASSGVAERERLRFRKTIGADPNVAFIQVGEPAVGSPATPTEGTANPRRERGDLEARTCRSLVHAGASPAQTPVADRHPDPRRVS